jgi:hypothetical protein
VSNHFLFDSVRGATNVLGSNQTIVEYSNGDFGLGTNQFTVGDNGGSDDYNPNKNAATYVAWLWAAGGAAVTNTSGTISSQVSANPTAGFSIVTYTGNGTGGATIGHGLGVAPSMIIVKARGNAYNWMVYHTSIGNTGAINLNLTAVTTTSSTWWNNTSPTSSVFTVGTDANMNQSSATYVAYCFAPIAGYSAFGSYTGNGSTDGPFVYLGFRPRFIMRKRTDTTAYWVVYDTARNTYNVVGEDLYPNDSLAGSNDFVMDILSNGFKIRGSGANINANGGTYIYMAFAESPFKYSNAR